MKINTLNNKSRGIEFHPAPLVYFLSELKRQIKLIETYTNQVDIDIVDWGSTSKKTIDVHQALSLRTDLNLNFDLMMLSPNHAIKALIHDQRVQYIILNTRCKQDLNQQIKLILDSGKKVGLSINPLDDVADYIYLFPKLYLIQIYTVEPGSQGMPFLSARLEEVNRIKQLGFKGKIAIDGGVNLKTLPIISKYPIDIASVGSALSKAENPARIYKLLSI